MLNLPDALQPLSRSRLQIDIPNRSLRPFTAPAVQPAGDEQYWLALSQAAARLVASALLFAPEDVRVLGEYLDALPLFGGPRDKRLARSVQRRVLQELPRLLRAALSATHRVIDGSFALTELHERLMRVLEHTYLAARAATA